jgi:hypothetical protein
MTVLKSASAASSVASCERTSPALGLSIRHAQLGYPHDSESQKFRSRQVAQVGTVENTVSWTNTPGFAISPDSRWLLYTSLESSDADLMLVDDFR